MKDFLAIIKASKKEVKQEAVKACVNSLKIGVNIVQKKGLLVQSSWAEVEVGIFEPLNEKKRIDLIEIDVYERDLSYNGVKITDISALNKELIRLGLEAVEDFEDVNVESEVMKTAVESHPVVITYLNSY